MHSTTVAVDLAKSVFEIAVSQRPGKVSARRRLSRGQFSRLLAEQAPATVVMEACGMAHFWGREAGARGHRVVLLPPHAVRPTCCATRPTGPTAPRARAHDSGRRAPGGPSRRGPRLGRRLGSPGRTPARARRSGPRDSRARGARARDRSRARRPRERQRSARAAAHDPLTATALLAFVGDAHRFPSGRHLASYLGLTPRESSSGLRRRLGAIGKRGDPYLRMLLIHGARSVLHHAKKASGQGDRLRRWALDRERARGHNKAAVALANKLARVVWAVWHRERAFGVPAQPPGGVTHPEEAASSNPTVTAHRF